MNAHADLPARIPAKPNRALATLRALLLLLVGTPVLAGPWLFGAWEQWWFWAFLVPLSLGAAVLGAILLLDPTVGARTRPLHGVALTALPFLLYLAARTCQAPVVMESQRACLLHATGWLVAAMVVFGLDQRHRRLLGPLLLVDLALLGLYGVVNHAATGSRYVLWAPGYAQYYLDGRASGTYYCPNHFAGIMELLFALAGAGFVARAATPRKRAAFGLAAFVALLGVIVSRSRGGMLTIALVAVLLGIWGLRQLPPYLKWSWRAVAISVGGLALLTFCHVDSGLRERFIQYVGQGYRPLGLREQVERFVTERLPTTSRGRMFGGAIRAWKTAPWVGIGPGMHAIIWPHVAATTDGNRELGIWPSRTNEDFFSFEVHSDWLQLLEETGLIGILLFALPFLALLNILLHAMRLEQASWRWHGWHRTAFRTQPVVLGGFLAFWAMAFHSLGDFNLQMPATVWLLAALLALSAAGGTIDAACADNHAHHHHQ